MLFCLEVKLFEEDVEAGSVLLRSVHSLHVHLLTKLKVVNDDKSAPRLSSHWVAIGLYKEFKCLGMKFN